MLGLSFDSSSCRRRKLRLCGSGRQSRRRAGRLRASRFRPRRRRMTDFLFPSAGALMSPEKLQWKELYQEVVTSGLCTGCAGCVIVCPHDVLGYNDDEGVYKPFQFEEGFGPDNCSHGEKGCTSCTRACPRFRAWEPEIDEFMYGRTREAIEVEGVSKDIVLARATDPVLAEVGQDGGLVSAILLYAIEHDVIDAALVSYLEGDGSTWKAKP